MKTITLSDLKNKETLRVLLEFVKSQHSNGTIKNHIFKIGLIKHRRLTNAAALKVMELANN
tara:strand:- start:370 stop:552 length:183 start_codon:yes stop_codon:yes gene_type:complete